MFLPITRYGPLEVPGGEDLISRFLERYGEWSYFETDFLRRVIPSGVRILDIGAYVGTFSLGILQSAPQKIVSVEVNPMAYQYLQNNLKRNCAIDFVAVNAAVGTELNISGNWKYSQQNNFGSFQYINESSDDISSDNTAKLTVNCVTIKELRQTYGDFEFLKLDIEGAELAALEADVDWIKSAYPTIWLECNEDPRSFLLYDFLDNIGYSVYYFSYPSHNPENFFGATNPIFPVAFEAGMLCIPADRYMPLPKHFIDAGCEFIKVLNAEHLRQCLWVTPRWGVPNWSTLSRTRLLATCAHLYKGENYATYLGGIPKAE
jgi:FkbM family methyltransferase